MQPQAARMSFGFFSSVVGAFVQVDRQSAYGLGQDPYTSPYSRDGEGAFLGDIDSLGVIRNGVSEKRLVDSGLELRRCHTLLATTKR